MKIAYLILAHNTPRHLQRLITALSSTTSSFFIHLDKKSNIDDFLSIREENVHFTQERVPVFLSDFSIVEATLILIKTALKDQRHFDRFVLLSGADYPLRSASYIEQFFEKHPNKEFISLVAMPNDAAGKSISRLTTYSPRPGDRMITKVIQKGLMKTGILAQTRDYKTVLRHYSLYGGSAWWALSREACEFILTFVKEETRVVNFLKNTRHSDEFIFQTILGNSNFRSRIVRNLTYTDWIANQPHPKYITEKHLDFFQEMSFAPDGQLYGGEKLFARKFFDDSEDLVAKLKKQIAEKEDRLTHST